MTIPANQFEYPALRPYSHAQGCQPGGPRYEHGTMRRLLLLLVFAPGCFEDAPALDEATAEESSSSGAGGSESDEVGSSDGEESSSTGESLVPLYGVCERDEDCEGGTELALEDVGVSCVASTCLSYHFGTGELAAEPCAIGEIAVPRGTGSGWEICMLAADTSTGLAVCPETMSTAVWADDDGTLATCWNATLVSGPTCESDDDCSDGAHCMGQPWYTNGDVAKLPNVCR